MAWQKNYRGKGTTGAPAVLLRFILGCVATVLATGVHAHHNAASHYVMDQVVSVTGTVAEFRLINPHVRIYFTVETDDGSTEKWLAEGNAAGVLKRRGWTQDMLSPGDRITVTGRPARDGGNKVDWETIVLEDGTEIRGGNTVAGERQRQLDELEQRRRQQRAATDSTAD
ncbi:DUF6152 family protein [Elongatibacter sediminis]|uniref:DUF6152 family protein n=1 Tax=Elongatibacter sediminis TaxID=3119006 RepID=A0AAW9RAC3_9GAMM